MNTVPGCQLVWHTHTHSECKFFRDIVRPKGIIMNYDSMISVIQSTSHTFHLTYNRLNDIVSTWEILSQTKKTFHVSSSYQTDGYTLHTEAKTCSETGYSMLMGQFGLFSATVRWLFLVSTCVSHLLVCVIFLVRACTLIS